MTKSTCTPNFEPYEAHRLFPCFDQPDIKAEYELTVDAPPQWELISNAIALAVVRLDDDRIPPPLREDAAPSAATCSRSSPGPYHAFRESHDGMPIAFFARRSLVRHVDVDELWEVTKQGLDFYASFFDYAYPFTKYDQVFVPEFNAGAMENVGAVTHSERLVFRPIRRRRRSGSRAPRCCCTRWRTCGSATW